MDSLESKIKRQQNLSHRFWSRKRGIWHHDGVSMMKLHDNSAILYGDLCTCGQASIGDCLHVGAVRLLKKRNQQRYQEDGSHNYHRQKTP